MKILLRVFMRPWHATHVYADAAGSVHRKTLRGLFVFPPFSWLDHTLKSDPTTLTIIALMAQSRVLDRQLLT